MSSIRNKKVKTAKRYASQARRAHVKALRNSAATGAIVAALQ